MFETSQYQRAKQLIDEHGPLSVRSSVFADIMMEKIFGKLQTLVNTYTSLTVILFAFLRRHFAVVCLMLVAFLFLFRTARNSMDLLVFGSYWQLYLHCMDFFGISSAIGPFLTDGV